MTDRRLGPGQRRRSRTGVAAAAAVVAAGGWVAWRELTHGSGHALAYRDLTARVGPLEFPRPASHAYTSRADLLDYLRRAMPGRAPRLPPIDFARTEAVLATAGPRSSSGYALRVVEVREEQTRVLVVVRERTPSLGEPVRAAVTYPFRLLTIPRTTKRVVVHWQGRP